MKNQTLADRVCEQIKEDVSNLDESAIHEMLRLISNTEAKSLLINYLYDGRDETRNDPPPSQKRSLRIIAKAVNEYQSDDVQIDYCAEPERVDGGAWVQARVWVDYQEGGAA